MIWGDGNLYDFGHGFYVARTADGYQVYRLCKGHMRRLETYMSLHQALAFINAERQAEAARMKEKQNKEAKAASRLPIITGRHRQRRTGGDDHA